MRPPPSRRSSSYSPSYYRTCHSVLNSMRSTRGFQIVWHGALMKMEGKPRPMHKKLLTWAGDVGQVISGRGAKIPSWTFAVPLEDGSPCTLFGVYADGTIWLYRFPDLPADRMARYTQCLQSAPKLKAALASGKLWFQVGIQDEGVLQALRAAIRGIRPATAADSE